MIRVVTFDPYEPKALKKLCDALYAAFGVGCEHAGSVDVPPGLGEPYDAAKLVEGAAKVRSYADDKVLYVTSKKLRERVLPSGTAPTHGCAQYGGDRTLISTAGVKSLEDQVKLVARHALHQLGHAWDLHHCLDPRCAMYPPWTPSFAAADSVFCAFCRDKSERKIRLGKS